MSKKTRTPQYIIDKDFEDMDKQQGDVIAFIAVYLFGAIMGAGGVAIMFSTGVFSCGT